MKYDLITIGGATEDVTLHTDEGVIIDNKDDVLRQKLLAFEYGAKINITHSKATYGGGAANVAVASSLLGLRSSAIVAVGDDDRGDRIISNLAARGVNIALIQRIKNFDSGLSFLVVGQGNEHVVFSSRGANSFLTINDKACENIKKSEWVYITSLSGRWSQTLSKVFKIGPKKIAWNPGHVQLKSGVKDLVRYLKKTDVLIFNKDEAIELAMSDEKGEKKSPEYFNEIGNLLRVIKSYGPKIVIITNGSFGAHAFDGENDYYQPVIKEKKRVDTTGVGDAFGASFVSGMVIYNGDIKKSLLLAAKNTASAVGKEGAQNGLLTKKDI